MDRIGADFFDAIKTMREKLACQCHSRSLPNRRRIRIQRNGRPHHDASPVFHDETLGADWEETDIPADLLEKCKKMRAEL